MDCGDLDDNLVWTRAADGVFNVESSYWLAQSLSRDGHNLDSAGSSWDLMGHGRGFGQLLLDNSHFICKCTLHFTYFLVIEMYFHERIMHIYMIFFVEN